MVSKHDTGAGGCESTDQAGERFRRGKTERIAARLGGSGHTGSRRRQLSFAVPQHGENRWGIRRAHWLSVDGSSVATGARS